MPARSPRRTSSRMVSQQIRKYPLPTLRNTIENIPLETILSISSTQLTLALPTPPSINHQYATVKGRRVLSSTGRQYKRNVGQQIHASLRMTPGGETLLNNLQTHTLTLSIKFFFRTALRRDIDGGLKIAQDAICHALDINDNRIVEIHLYKAIDSTCPRMECTLSSQRPLASSIKTRNSKNIRLHPRSAARLSNATKRSGERKSTLIRKPTT